MIHDFKNKKITAEELSAAMGAYSQVEKRIGHMLKGFALASQAKKSYGLLVMQTGLIGDDLIVDVEPKQAASERVVCDDQNKVITREECKNRSGDPMHMDQCQECETNKSTRRLIVQTLEGKTFQ
jgi:hypothetical protein